MCSNKENSSIEATVKEIRQTFRLLMNGVTAQSQRDKGVNYHINWGASLGHLRELAAEYIPNKTIAEELWLDNVRESKLMAVFLMPVEQFTADMALRWIAQTDTQEIAEVASMHLMQYLPKAKNMAMQLSSSHRVIDRLYAYCILSKLLQREGAKLLTLEERSSILSQTDKLVADESAPMWLRHAAYNTQSICEDVCSIQNNTK